MEICRAGWYNGREKVYVFVCVGHMLYRVIGW
jgi:hypothetical protein